MAVRARYVLGMDIDVRVGAIKDPNRERIERAVTELVTLMLDQIDGLAYEIETPGAVIDYTELEWT